MANQLIFALPRVTDSNGDPASGALAYFYQTGTTSPVTVYTDTGLSVAHASPVVADSGGFGKGIVARHGAHLDRLRNQVEILRGRHCAKQKKRKEDKVFHGWLIFVLKSRIAVNYRYW